MTPHLIRALRREIREAYMAHIQAGKHSPFRVDIQRLIERGEP